jgi:hypothetical protein
MGAAIGAAENYANGGGRAGSGRNDRVDGPTPDEPVAIAGPYRRPAGATTPEQRVSVQGKPCIACGAIGEVQVADHVTPLVKEYYATGQIDEVRMRSVQAVQPQCTLCSDRQGAAMAQFSKEMKKFHGFF